MMNTEKIHKYRKAVFIGLAVLLFFTGLAFGVTFGSADKQAAVNAAKKSATPSEQVETSRLKERSVTKFLIAYYTKKDLEENRSRYRPLMTSAMYNQTVTDEESPVNQTYKGYIVNQVFQDATIYVDTKDLTAICQVDYKNTQLSNKNDKSSGMQNTMNHDTLRLTFQKQGNKYLVNKIERITLVEPTGGNNQNTYPDSPSVPSSTSSSSQPAQPGVSN